MPIITSATFYFANPTQDANGNPILTAPPESHTLTWQQVIDNVGFSLSTGESMFTELPDPMNDHIIRLINGFYFGAGVYGSLLGIQYKYDDGSDGWISAVPYQSANSQNLSMITGNWIKGLSYQQITSHANWTGQPYIGLENDYAEVIVERILPEMTLSLDPLIQTVTKGGSVTFTYSAIDYCDGAPTYTWTYDQTAVQNTSQTSNAYVLQFNQAGTYTIKLNASNTCGQSVEKTAVITVNNPVTPPTDPDPEPEPEPDDDVGEVPPTDPAPPEEPSIPSIIVNLVDASKLIPSLHKYPNIMKRNSRYRGHRESEKVLNDHQEQIYDIRQIHKDIENLNTMKDTTINSWFNGLETVSISMKAKENQSDFTESSHIPIDTDVDTIRAFQSDVIQWSGNNFEDRIVGIYGIKRRMQELDERIAEAERRYKGYENAYE